MTISWDIDPAGTQAVLRTAAADIEQQNQAATRLGTAVDEAGAVVGGGLVGRALSDYVEISLLPHLTAIAGRSDRIIDGATGALVAYMRADSVMAQQATASALTAGGLEPDGGGSISWGGRLSREQG
ncbi:DUF6507 family protein [Paenarthrobacter sp. NPDC056912]|uniref:DUF6507 family protein n=1 Tax=Paenarthrobacter sp. NPDC056912 TaxID=3345965 RepID=UPI00367231F6